MTGILDRANLLELLDALDAELGRRDVQAELFVVGGAAIALAYDARRSTSDVDAVFVPAAEVRLAARSVAEARELDPDWLNDGVKGFLPGDDDDETVAYEGANLTVAVASAPYLLAMKLLASRADRDVDDIVALYALCGFTTAEQGFELLEQYYPSSQILPRVQFLLEELFPSS